MGKFHTPFGYWNNAYHHGALLQPTISRPHIVSFEDEGGLLPIHQVGAQLDGSGISKFNIGYRLMLSNGQNKGNTGGDLSYNGKFAVSGSVSFEPVSNLNIIVSGMSDRSPAGSVTYQGIILSENSSYTMLNTGITYFDGRLPVEWAAEVYQIRNSINQNICAPALGWYGYFGFKQFRVRPYITYSSVQFDSTEEYFDLNSAVKSTTLGVRYNPSGQAVIKLEYSHDKYNAGNDLEMVRLQVAIGF